MTPNADLVTYGLFHSILPKTCVASGSFILRWCLAPHFLIHAKESCPVSNHGQQMLTVFEFRVLISLMHAQQWEELQVFRFMCWFGTGVYITDIHAKKHFQMNRKHLILLRSACVYRNFNVCLPKWFPTNYKSMNYQSFSAFSPSTQYDCMLQILAISHKGHFVPNRDIYFKFCWGNGLNCVN